MNWSRIGALLEFLLVQVTIRNKPNLLLLLLEVRRERNAAIDRAVKSTPPASSNLFAVEKKGSLCLTPRNVAKPSEDSTLYKLGDLEGPGHVPLKPASKQN